MVAVSVPVYNTDTRTQPEHYDCTEQVMIAVRHGDCFCTGLQHGHKNMTVQNRPLYNTDTRIWLYRTGRCTTLTQEYDCTEQAAVQYWHTHTHTQIIDISQRRRTDYIQAIMTQYRLLADTVIICSIHNSFMLFPQSGVHNPLQSKELKRVVF